MPSSNSYRVLEKNLRLLRLIQSGRSLSKRQLAEELDVHQKTLGRYLDTLGLVGFDFDSDEDGNFRPVIRLRPHTRQRTFDHLITLTR